MDLNGGQITDNLNRRGRPNADSSCAALGVKRSLAHRDFNSRYERIAEVNSKKYLTLSC